MAATSSAQANDVQGSRFAIVVYPDATLAAYEGSQQVGTVKRGDEHYGSYLLEALHGVYTRNYDVQVHFVEAAA